MSIHHHPDTPGSGAPHGHVQARWSAIASGVGGRLLRLLPAVAFLWLAVAWALAAGTE